MPCMKMCCFYVSTRLGSIIVGFLSMLQVFVAMIVLLVSDGADGLKANALRIKGDSDSLDLDEVGIFVWILNQIESNPDEIFLAIVSLCGIHIFSCGILIFGALKLNKYLLLPFIVMDFIRLCILSLTHVIGMMVIKKQLNLGDLIAVTIAGGFGLLLLFYLWACVVALYQIIGIVQTEKYRALFGNDPTARVEVPEETIINVQPSIKNTEQYFTYNSNFSNEYIKSNRSMYIP